MPWATWYETRRTGFGANNIFASRFDNTGDANQGKWIFAGQGRGTGGGTVPVPSLNIHTDQDAENPSVAGGSRRRPDQARPVDHLAGDVDAPARQPTRSSSSGRSARAATNCNGVTPAASTAPARARDRRLLLAADRDRRASAPDARPEPERRPDASTASSPTSPSPAPTTPCRGWSGTRPGHRAPSGLQRTNGMVFAAKGVTDGVAPNGGFHWVAGLRQRRTRGARHVRGPTASGPCADIARRRGRLLAEHQPHRRRRGPARRRRHDEPGQPDGAVGGVGRGHQRAPSGVRQPPGRHRHGGAVRARQQRAADLDRDAATPRAPTSRSRATRRT